MSQAVFEEFESNVRFYCRDYPSIFRRASGAELVDTTGKVFVDFLAGAGALNYGHNDPDVIRSVVAYLTSGGISHSLDLFTEAKLEFIEAMQAVVLAPRGMSYKIQFPGPTGTNAVEAALKLARKRTGRVNIISFTGGYHGMSLGALAATSNLSKRRAAGAGLSGITFMPYDHFLGDEFDTADVIERTLTASNSGIDDPAAFIVEMVQGEGGVNVASPEWVTRIARLARACGALLIVDDIQAGVGRTGRFFSFEDMEIEPDIVLLSKSLSGFGSPLSVVLIKPEHDVWEPGEHNGTFRGNNLAFVGAKAAIEKFWRDDALTQQVARQSKTIRDRLDKICRAHPNHAMKRKGRGMLIGLEIGTEGLAREASARAYSSGLIVETCGPRDSVLKLIPPLTISDRELEAGLDILCNSVSRCCASSVPVAAQGREMQGAE